MRFADSNVNYINPDKDECAHLVNRLQTSVVFEGLERSPVALPQELEPGGDQRTIRTVLALVSTDSSEQDAFGGLTCLQIVDIDGRLNCRLLLRLQDLCVRKLDEFCDDGFDALHARILGDVFVLHEALLRGAALSHVDTKLNETVHDGLQRRQRCRPESF